MRKLHASRSRSSALRVLVALGVAAGCAPQTDAPAPETIGLAADPSALGGEFKTYVADYFDGRAGERYHTLRQANGQELRLHFDSEPSIVNGSHIYIRGEAMANQAMHVSQFDLGPALAGHTSALEGDNPELIAAPLNDTYAIVLVDLGMGVDITAAQAQARLNGAGTNGTTGSFAQYYAESSYGKYTVSPTSTVFGPFQHPMTACANADTSAMATAIDAMIPAGFNHVIMYFQKTGSPCTFGGLGEEGSSVRPSKHTWMNGSLGCVVLMQEPGHNLGLMHANQIKCGTSTFSATPATACTITEYANSMSTMGSGCKTLSGYERMYEQWMNGCNAVKVPGSGTFNLMPLETPCGGGIQTLQVPFPAVLPVSDPQAGANTVVNLRNYYLDLRVAGGTFDAYGTTRGQGAGITFTGPTVFIYTSDDVRNPTPGTGRNAGMLTQQSSVWTELLNTTPTGTAFTGLTAAGQSFVDPAGGPTITLQAISATGAIVQITNGAGVTTGPTCLDGTTPPSMTAGGPMGSTTCGPVTTSDGGVVTGIGGAPGFDAGAGAGGRTGTGGVAGGMGGAPGGMAGRPGTDGGTTATGGNTGTAGGPGATGPGGGGGPIGTGGSGAGGGKGPGEGPGGVTGGCGCSVPSGDAPAWASLFGTLAVVLLRRRRRGIR